MDDEPLFDRIRATLQGTPDSDEIEQTITSTNAAIAEEERWRMEYEATATSPLVSSAEAQGAADDIVKSHLKSKRLQAALVHLGPMKTNAIEQEHQARIESPYLATKAAREKMRAEFSREYTIFSTGIVGLLNRMRDMDESLTAIETPAGRSVLSPFRNEICDIVDNLILPACASDEYLWGRNPNEQMSMTELNSQRFGRTAGWP